MIRSATSIHACADYDSFMLTRMLPLIVNARARMDYVEIPSTDSRIRGAEAWAASKLL